ncbi:MAG: hypothetical protein IT444_11540 [Phycisphaeraceae bacterium]|nr:hypothetical protein [Phycisphaeraceae bacterium]
MIRSLTASLRPLLRPKRFEAFCVGLPRAGTHSVAAMFSGYRAAHEPGGESFLKEILRYTNGTIEPSEMTNLLRRRNRQQWLEMESAPFDVFIVELLVELFPKANFILTTRDCYSWIDSVINDELSRPDKSGTWAEYRKLCFGDVKYDYAPQEQPLREKGLWPLAGYFSYWKMHMRRVLQAVPASRLMVVDVTKLMERSADLAEFVGVPARSLDLDQTHVFKVVRKFQMLSQLDPRFVRAAAEEHCDELMHRFFPCHESNLLAPR